MKKKILILCGILVGMYLVLSLVDTSEYRVEKRLWRLHKHLSSLAQDPKAVPDAQFDRLINDYRGLIKRFPKSRYVPQMHSEIGSLYLMNHKFSDARAVYGEVVAKFSDQTEVVAKAMVDIGNTHVFENRMDLAVPVFLQIQKQYGRTEVGFMMPLYIAGLYRNANQLSESRAYLDKAVQFYREIIDNDQEPEVVRLSAYQSLATTYIAQEKWEDALGVLKRGVVDFADSDLMTPQRLSMLTRMINVIAVVHLNDYDKAIGFYTNFIQDHPGHPLNQFLEKVIESLHHLEQNQGSAVLSQP